MRLFIQQCLHDFKAVLLYKHSWYSAYTMHMLSTAEAILAELQMVRPTICSRKITIFSPLTFANCSQSI